MTRFGSSLGHLLTDQASIVTIESGLRAATVRRRDAPRFLATLTATRCRSQPRLTAAQRNAALVLKTGLERYNDGLGCLLAIEDPSVAASHFNWLIMADPLNRAMLLGDDAIPAGTARRRHVAKGVRVFLAAYGTRPSSKRQVKGARRSL